MKSTYLIILSSLFLLSCTNFLDEESTGTMSIDSNLSLIPQHYSLTLFISA